MKNKYIALIATLSTLLWQGAAIGDTTVEDLKLSCGGNYEVLSSKPYYKPPHYRVPGQAGTGELIKVLSLEGEDCEVLKTHYGISVEVGQTLKYGVQTAPFFSTAQKEAESRQGKVFPFEVSQTFNYQNQSGKLPLFPTVHEETAHLLNLTGKAYSNSLYGSLSVDELSDEQKLFAVKKAIWAMDWGKVFQSTTGIYSHRDWLQLFLDFVPNGQPALGEYMQNLLSFFKNVVKFNSSFVTLHPGVKVGEKLNALLNQHGKTKFQTKLEVLKKNPMLFEDQIVGWAFVYSKENVPQLTADEIVEFLQYALEQAQNLAKVPQVTEARYLLSQYKIAATTMSAYSGEVQGKSKYFDLSPEAQTLIEQILAATWSF